MAVEKKSLLNGRAAAKKALIASETSKTNSKPAPNITKPVVGKTTPAAFGKFGVNKGAFGKFGVNKGAFGKVQI
jgi:hypothetical protein